MTTYYVDWEKADNSGNGLTLATAKKTLNGAEDIPVAAGDFVWVRPGVYREELTVDVSGSNGSPITYQGDVAGQIWHPGGVVRITGSDDDLTTERQLGIHATSKNFRTFKGFLIDFGYSDNIRCNTGCQDWILEDLTLVHTAYYWNNICIHTDGDVKNWIIRRCIFSSPGDEPNLLINGIDTEYNDANILIENCMFLPGAKTAIQDAYIGGVTARNCLFWGFYNQSAGAVSVSLLDTGQKLSVKNSIFYGNYRDLAAGVSGQIEEDYNLFSSKSGYGNTNVTPGDNSLDQGEYGAPLFNHPILYRGHRLPASFIGELSPWSPVSRRTDNGSASSDDLFGLTRPVTNGKRSWGPIQFTGAVRETTITDGGGASLKLPDAGEQFFMRVPTSASEITIAIKVYREADYAGTLPQLVVRQPGQADETDTDAGSAEQFNTLSVTFTPDALPPWVDVFIRSNNTAAAGDYATYWDTLTVT